MSTQIKDSDCIEIYPDSPVKKSVIWLHGLGADGHDFVPIVPELQLPDALGVRFLFPHAPVMPVTINQGYRMRAWFDIYDAAIAGKIDEAGIKRSIRTVEALILREIERGIPAESIMLAGFSQGAVIALLTGLHHDMPLSGIIALSGYLPHAETILAHAHSANSETPIFIAHGTEDAVVPYMLGEATYLALKKANYPASLHTYAMPHSVCPDEIADISQWMQQRWKS